MIPYRYSHEIKSSGEKKIFDKISQEPGTENWIVLHSLLEQKHIKRKYGEIDFLVLAPDLGIFILEVKSGRVSRHDGIWQFMDRYNRTSTKNYGPFEQAHDAMYSLIDHVRDFSKGETELAHFIVGYGVIFPHIRYQVQGPDEEGWMVYDRGSLGKQIKKYIQKLSTEYKRKSPRAKAPSKSDIFDILNMLRGDFEYLPSIDDVFEENKNRINYYTNRQVDILDGLSNNNRLFVDGAAGTGKTVLALEAAKRAAFHRKTCLFTCYNKMLADWISEEIPRELKKFIRVQSIHKFMSEIADSPPEIEGENYFAETLPFQTIMQFEEKDLEQYDVLVVDEIQDLISDEYLEVFDSVTRGGLSGGSWFFTGDINEQIIFNDSNSVELVDKLDNRSEYTFFKLNRNCRNPEKIAIQSMMLSNIYIKDLIFSDIGEQDLTIDYYDSPEAGIKKLKNILDRLKKRGIKKQNIMILSPYQLNKSFLADYPHKNEIIDISSNFSLKSNMSINFSTIQSFKGLEEYCIIIIDIDDLSSVEIRHLMYVAASRSKYGLYLMLNNTEKKRYSKLLSNYMEAANAS